MMVTCHLIRAKLTTWKILAHGIQSITIDSHCTYKFFIKIMQCKVRRILNKSSWISNSINLFNSTSLVATITFKICLIWPFQKAATKVYFFTLNLSSLQLLVKIRNDQTILKYLKPPYILTCLFNSFLVWLNWGGWDLYLPHHFLTDRRYHCDHHLSGDADCIWPRSLVYPPYIPYPSHCSLKQKMDKKMF